MSEPNGLAGIEVTALEPITAYEVTAANIGAIKGWLARRGVDVWDDTTSSTGPKLRTREGDYNGPSIAVGNIVVHDSTCGLLVFKDNAELLLDFRPVAIASDVDKQRHELLTRLVTDNPDLPLADACAATLNALA